MLCFPPCRAFHRAHNVEHRLQVPGAGCLPPQAMDDFHRSRLSRPLRLAANGTPGKAGGFLPLLLLTVSYPPSKAAAGAVIPEATSFIG